MSAQPTGSVPVVHTRASLRADLERLPADAQAVHVGSYCMVVEPVASTLRALVERQRGRSLIVYDPNVRLTIEPRAEVWRETLCWMMRRTDVLKVSALAEPATRAVKVASATGYPLGLVTPKIRPRRKGRSTLTSDLPSPFGLAVTAFQPIQAR